MNDEPSKISEAFDAKINITDNGVPVFSARAYAREDLTNKLFWQTVGSLEHTAKHGSKAEAKFASNLLSFMLEIINKSKYGGRQ